jgi:uncharacterized protein YkwD
MVDPPKLVSLRMYLISFSVFNNSRDMKKASSIATLMILYCLNINIGCFAQKPEGIGNYKQNLTDFRKDPLYQQPIDFDSIDFSRIQQVIFYLTNEIRQKNNLKTLIYAAELEKSATMHARDMIKDNFFDHINPNDKLKRTPNDRALLCGISNPALAENIIEGFGLQYKANDKVYTPDPGRFSKTPGGPVLKPNTYLEQGEAMLDGWMHSRDHRLNILSKDALQLGCGVAYFVNTSFNDMPSFYAVQNFQCYELIVPVHH